MRQRLKQRPRDSQRSAVYAWEKSLPEWEVSQAKPLSLDECEALVVRVWNDYVMMPPPRVTDGRGRRRGCANQWRIKLPKFARHTLYVLHEVTHAIMDRYAVWWKAGYASHGREFARLYMTLLDRYGGVDAVRARRLGIQQKPRRVRFASRDAVPQLVAKTGGSRHATYRWMESAAGSRADEKPTASCAQICPSHPVDGERHECMTDERRCVYCGTALRAQACHYCKKWLTTAEMNASSARLLFVCQTCPPRSTV